MIEALKLNDSQLHKRTIRVDIADNQNKGKGVHYYGVKKSLWLYLVAFFSDSVLVNLFLSTTLFSTSRSRAVVSTGLASPKIDEDLKSEDSEVYYSGSEMNG